MDLRGLPILFLLVRQAVQALGSRLTVRGKQVLALAFGAALTYTYHVNILAEVGLHTNMTPFDFLLNSLLVGLGAMGTHDVLDYYKNGGKK